MLKTNIVPRICETNAAGHIGHTVIPVWMEAGLEGMFRIFNPRSSVEQMNLAIVSLGVDYLSEMYYGQEVQVISQVKRIGKSSLEIYQEIYQGGQLCARGTTTFVHFNYRERRPQPIPPSVAEKLREHLVADS